jgi:hypothetical protein
MVTNLQIKQTQKAEIELIFARPDTFRKRSYFIHFKSAETKKTELFEDFFPPISSQGTCEEVMTFTSFLKKTTLFSMEIKMISKMHFSVMRPISVFFLALLFITCSYAAETMPTPTPTPLPTPTPPRYEGLDVILDAPATGGERAVRTSGNGGVKVNLNIASLTACNGSALGVISSTETMVFVDSTSLRWCFETTVPGFKLWWNNVGSTISYSNIKWLPDSAYTGFVSVKDFDAKGDGIADDTEAIRNALLFLAGKTGGTLYFPVGQYKVTKTLTLPSGIVLQGVSGRSSSSFFTGAGALKTQTKIIYAGNPSTDPSIFRIGELQESIRLRDIELIGASESGTSGVEAVGRETSVGQGTTQLISFDNMIFTNFDIAINVHNGVPTKSQTACTGECDEWHFDYVKLDSCQFTHNLTAGIYVDTFNTDWSIKNTNFALPKKQSGRAADAIYIKRAGAFNVQSTFAGGDDPTTAPGGDFLDVQYIGLLSINNSGAEALDHGLVYGQDTEAGTLSSAITVVSSALSDILLTKPVNYISSGNKYGGQNVVTTSAGIRIYSTGDRFCGDADTVANPCGPGVTLPLPADQHIGFQGIGKVMFQTGQLKNGLVPAIPATFNADTNDEGSSVLKVVVPDVSGKEKPLLELGTEVLDSNGNAVLNGSGDPTKFVYRLSRDKISGYLKFTGTQGSPWQGYIFDAPLRISSKTQSQLASEGVAGVGALIYCVDCVVGSSPCSGGGSGALAVSSATQWNCK